ncbi:MAG TPA: sulfotransferase domain-containing protein [Candidatus Binatia bacterium]|jgi:aryl sulfotransferase
MHRRRNYHTVVDDTSRWDGFVPRSDDVFVCTPAKCGTTWMQSIIASLLWPDTDPPGPVLAISPWIEMTLVAAAEMYAMLDAQTHRRFMKTHTPADGIPWFDDARYVFVVRDGRDAFISLCNHVEHFRAEVRDSLNAEAPPDVAQFPTWDGDVHAFFARWLDEEHFFPHVATFWAERQRPNLLLVHYNDLKADLEGEMRRVAAFIGADVPEACWPEVVARCTFERMREGVARIGAVDMMFEGGLKTFVFKGTNGRWRDVLTVEELAAYERRVAERLTPECAAWMQHGRRALASAPERSG